LSLLSPSYRLKLKLFFLWFLYIWFWLEGRQILTQQFRINLLPSSLCSCHCQLAWLLKQQFPLLLAQFWRLPWLLWLLKIAVLLWLQPNAWYVCLQFSLEIFMSCPFPFRANHFWVRLRLLKSSWEKIRLGIWSFPKYWFRSFTFTWTNFFFLIHREWRSTYRVMSKH